MEGHSLRHELVDALDQSITNAFTHVILRAHCKMARQQTTFQLPAHRENQL